jgi:uncharacterized membrane protein YfcA
VASLESIFLLVTIGIVSLFVGTFSIISGFGGGVYLVPILTVFFHMPLKTVIGTILLVLVLPSSVGAIGAWRRHEINFKLAFLFETPTAIGAVIGATFTALVPDFFLKAGKRRRE